MSLAVGIYLALVALPPAYGETESSVAREIRLADIAVAIDAASETDEEAAALAMEAWYETRLARKYHVMGPRKDTRGHAISLWSLHSWTLVPYQEWRTLGGLDGTPRAAVAAARVLRWSRKRCGSWEGAFALYATGRSCRWSGASQRAWMHRRILRQIRSVGDG